MITFHDFTEDDVITEGDDIEVCGVTFRFACAFKGKDGSIRSESYSYPEDDRERAVFLEREGEEWSASTGLIVLGSYLAFEHIAKDPEQAVNGLFDKLRAHSDALAERLKWWRLKYWNFDEVH